MAECWDWQGRDVKTPDLALVGMAIAGERRDVDKALDKLAMHP